LSENKYKNIFKNLYKHFNVPVQLFLTPLKLHSNKMHHWSAVHNITM